MNIEREPENKLWRHIPRGRRWCSFEKNEKTIVMRRIISTIVIFCLCMSCKNLNSNNSVNNDSIVVVKFMYSENYPFALDEVTFWKFPEEHAKLEWHTNDGENLFIKLRNYEKTDRSSFEFIKYAFIVKHKSKTDTIYADLDLSTWIVPRNGIKEYYEDKNGEFKEDLQTRYGFFKDCW